MALRPGGSEKLRSAAAAASTARTRREYCWGSTSSYSNLSWGRNSEL